MRIGIDARFLTHPQRGGFKTYTKNLINALCQVDDINQYFIYLDRSYNLEELPSKKNFAYRIVNGTMPSVGMIFREQILLPFYAARDNLDLFHSLCNTAPVFLPLRRIVTLHDTIQVASENKLRHPENLRTWAITAYSKWSIIRSLYKSDRVITVSNYEKSQIVGMFDIPEDRVVVTHLAANSVYKPATFDEKEKLRDVLEKKFGIVGDYILGVGYEDRKNIPLIIESYKQLMTEFPQMKLVIVAAEENKKNQFQRLVIDNNLGGCVIVLGSVSASDLSELYNLATVFVFPSERESFGLPPLEAISCGTPTIAMNSSSIPEIMRDGATLINGKEVGAWTEAIRMVLLNDKVRLAMVARGLKRASELKWKKCALETIEIYNQLA